jgi:hypothetical protein
MPLGQVLRPKEPRNLALTGVVAVLFVSVYAFGAWDGTWSPRRGLGLAFGFLSAALFVFEMSYPARRPKAFPLFTAKIWLQAHLYLGVLALLGVLLHSGFEWPHGKMGWALWLLSLWTVATGVMGVWLQKWIPAALAEGLRVEALFERIPELTLGLRSEADTLMQDVGEALEGFYQREVRPALGAPRRSWAYLLDVRAGQERTLEPFRRISLFVDPDEKSKVEDLMAIATEKRELDAHYSLQRLLRGWLILHVPMAGLLMALLIVHVFAWLWY